MPSALEDSPWALREVAAPGQELPGGAALAWLHSEAS